VPRRKKRPYTATKEEWAELAPQLHNTTKEEWEEIVRRLHSFTKEEWDEAIGNIQRGSYLDSAKFRKKADEFALALEKKGCQAHRDADRLEVLSYFRWKAKDVRSSDYARSTIKTELERKYDERFFHFVDFLFDELVETGLRMHKQLRQQAARILDVAEYMYEELAAHERLIKAIRRKRHTYPPHDKAAALVRRRINVQMKHKWPGEDLRNRFVLVPILHRNFSMTSGRDYFDRQWGVRVDGEMIGYVRGTYSGKPRFLAYGLSPMQYQIDSGRTCWAGDGRRRAR
jgi:hypothetical protein